MRDAGINQVGAFVGSSLFTPMHDGKCAFGGLGTFKNISRAAKDSGAGRADGKPGIESAGQDGGFGMNVLESFRFHPAKFNPAYSDKRHRLNAGDIEALRRHFLHIV